MVVRGWCLIHWRTALVAPGNVVGSWTGFQPAVLQQQQHAVGRRLVVHFC
jgi:hypothetical protein